MYRWGLRALRVSLSWKDRCAVEMVKTGALLCAKTVDARGPVAAVEKQLEEANVPGDYVWKGDKVIALSQAVRAPQYRHDQRHDNGGEREGRAVLSADDLSLLVRGRIIQSVYLLRSTPGEKQT